jgi:hypothetical protein
MMADARAETVFDTRFSIDDISHPNQLDPRRARALPAPLLTPDSEMIRSMQIGDCIFLSCWVTFSARDQEMSVMWSLTFQALTAWRA